MKLTAHMFVLQAILPMYDRIAELSTSNKEKGEKEKGEKEKGEKNDSEEAKGLVSGVLTPNMTPNSTPELTRVTACACLAFIHLSGIKMDSLVRTSAVIPTVTAVRVTNKEDLVWGAPGLQSAVVRTLQLY